HKRRSCPLSHSDTISSDNAAAESHAERFRDSEVFFLRTMPNRFNALLIVLSCTPNCLPSSLIPASERTSIAEVSFPASTLRFFFGPGLPIVKSSPCRSHSYSCVRLTPNNREASDLLPPPPTYDITRLRISLLYDIQLTIYRPFICSSEYKY